MRKIREETVNSFTKLTPPFFFRPKTENQKAALQSYGENDVTFIVGPAGSGKTFLAIAIALQEIFYKKRKHIVLTRPAVEADERLGFLPGDLNDKFDPYMSPLHDCVEKLMKGSVKSVKEYLDKISTKIPLAYMRGKTFDNSVCILDEAQNCTAGQIKMFLSRMGDNSKCVVTGDPDQSDLPLNVLPKTLKLLSNLPGVGIVRFEEKDIVRHALIGNILKRLSGL